MFSRRDFGDNTVIDDDLDFSEHAYVELGRWPHPFIGGANEIKKPASTLDIVYFNRMLRPLDANEFYTKKAGKSSP